MRRREQADPFYQVSIWKVNLQYRRMGYIPSDSPKTRKGFDRFNGRSENERDFTRLEVTELFDNVYHVYTSN